VSSDSSHDLWHTGMCVWVLQNIRRFAAGLCFHVAAAEHSVSSQHDNDVRATVKYSPFLNHRFL